MRKIRIKNVKPKILTHLVVALKAGNLFLLKEKVFEEMKRQANQANERVMSFTTDYGAVSVETVVELEKYSGEFYKICNITVNDFKVYGTSPWVEVVNEIVVIDAE